MTAKILAILLSLSFASCKSADEIENLDANTTDDDNADISPAVVYNSLISKIMAYPSQYSQANGRSGTLQTFSYTTHDYAEGTDTPRQNSAMVYLPYGYDDGDFACNVLYLVHGHYGDQNTFFSVHDNLLKNILDNMTANGDIAPTIVVTPTYNYGSPTQNYVDADIYCEALCLEIHNDLMPLVDKTFRTKTERQHRAIGGFSMGGVTTWYAFEQLLADFKYFMPVSGDCWSLGVFAGMNRPEATAEHLAEVAKNYNGDFYIWAASGTDDSAYRETLDQVEAMAKLDVFSTKTMTFHEKDGARHDYLPVMEYIYNALPFFFPTVQNPQTMSHYTKKSKISDVIADPDFKDFGRLIFPVNKSYYSGESLEDLRLTWYNGIDADKTVEIVNYMKANADRVFIDIYTEAEKQADPEKRNTGLFFFRGRPGAPFAVCNAGGGHVYVGAMHDSYPHALELSKRGYNAFALIYRPDWEPSDEDLARAVSYIYDHADELGVSRQNYSLWGGSAGARMAADMGNLKHLQGSTGRTDIPQAAAVVMQYTGYTAVSADDAPTYVCVGTSDGIASWQTMKNRLDAMSKLGIDTEFHAYEGLPHGFGLGTGTVAEGWIDDAVKFWERQM